MTTCHAMVISTWMPFAIWEFPLHFRPLEPLRLTRLRWDCSRKVRDRRPSSINSSSSSNIKALECLMPMRLTTSSRILLRSVYSNLTAFWPTELGAPLQSLAPSPAILRPQLRIPARPPGKLASSRSCWWVEKENFHLTAISNCIYSVLIIALLWIHSVLRAAGATLLSFLAIQR